MGKFDTNKFKSESLDWETPTSLFEKLNNEFKFTLDVAASTFNAKVNKYFDKKINGLSQSWDENVCWMNPPYGNELRKWVEKAYHEGQKDNTTVVAFIPSKTNTIWWHTFVMKAKEIRFIQGRPKFGTSKHGLPFSFSHHCIQQA